MNAETRKTLIDQYKDGYRVVADALAGATAAELDAHPAPGKWSPREIVHHLADSEMTAAVRLRLLLASDSPRIVGFDQDEFARRLHYDTRPVAASLRALRAARQSTAELMELMTDADWQRAGTHTEHDGPFTCEVWLEIYGVHAHDHADQIRAARAAGREGRKGGKARKARKGRKGGSR